MREQARVRAEEAAQRARDLADAKLDERSRRRKADRVIAMPLRIRSNAGKLAEPGEVSGLQCEAPETRESASPEAKNGAEVMAVPCVGNGTELAVVEQRSYGDAKAEFNNGSAGPANWAARSTFGKRDECASTEDEHATTASGLENNACLSAETARVGLEVAEVAVVRQAVFGVSAAAALPLVVLV